MPKNLDSFQLYPERFAKIVTVSTLTLPLDDYGKMITELKEKGIQSTVDKLELVRLEKVKAIKDLNEKRERLLRKISKQVDINKPEEVKKVRDILKLLEELLVVSQHSDGRPEEVIGIGIAAIQLLEIAGQEWVPRASVVRIPSESKKPFVLDMINPQIIRGIHPYKHVGEGCMSYPGHYLSTHRFYGVRLGFIDAKDLKPREMELYGIEALCVQHEVDHHDGLLFKDKHNFPLMVKAKQGPNDLCSCSSGKKYKKCCGAK